MTKRTKTCDAAVIGAGPAGLAAALTAARAGLDTLLFEREPRPGGAMRSVMHASICGLYGGDSDGVTDVLNGGIQEELVTRLNELAPAISRCRERGKTVILPFRMMDFERFWREHMDELPNLTMRCATGITDVRKSGRRVERLTMSDGTQILPGGVIDATGRAAVARMAGEDVLVDPREKRQLGAFSLRYRGISGDPSGLHLEVPYYLRKASERGDLPRQARYGAFSPVPDSDDGICKLAVPVSLFKKTASLAAYIRKARKVLSRSVSALNKARVVEMSPRAIPRDGARLRGMMVVERDDVLGARTFGEGVLSSWPMEFWHPEAGPQYEYVPAGKCYEIPPACLRGRHTHNLICTGRAVSASPAAAASLRVAGVCLALGQLAGELAVEMIR